MKEDGSHHHIPYSDYFKAYKLKACIAGVVREKIRLQIWIKHAEKPPCANFKSNWGVLQHYCDFCLMTRASVFSIQAPLNGIQKFLILFSFIVTLFRKINSAISSLEHLINIQ